MLFGFGKPLNTRHRLPPFRREWKQNQIEKMDYRNKSRAQKQHEYRNRMNMAIARTVKNKMEKTEIDEIEKIWRQKTTKEK